VSCLVCFEALVSEIPTLACAQRPDHTSSTAHILCGPCALGYVKYNLGTGPMDYVKCPEPKCYRELTLDDLRTVALVPADRIEVLETAFSVHALQASGSVKMCGKCKTVGYVEVTDLVDEPYVTCPTCESRTCTKCDLVYHNGQDCSVAARAHETQEANRLNASAGYQKCRCGVTCYKEEDALACNKVGL
jgi:hypothetical protein